MRLATKTALVAGVILGAAGGVAGVRVVHLLHPPICQPPPEVVRLAELLDRMPAGVALASAPEAVKVRSDPIADLIRREGAQ